MPAWDNLYNTVLSEIGERNQEGFDTTEAERIFSTIDKDDEEALNKLYLSLNNLSKREDYPFEEPDDYTEIIADSYKGDFQTITDNILKDKIYGGYLGRCIGCVLGKPLEAYPFVCGSKGKYGTYYIRKYLEGAGAYPLNDYIPQFSDYSKENPEAVVNQACLGSVKENLKYVETDDDIRYTLIGLQLVEKHGYSFTTLDVANEWVYSLAVSQVCTAETEAYINYTLEFSRSHFATLEEYEKKSNKIRMNYNPYREYLGARIRVDGYSLCAVNQPYVASKMAYNDARFSHTKNGIYGAIYASTLISMAYSENDVISLVDKAITFIPKKSRLHEAILFAKKTVSECDDFYEVANKIWDKYSSKYCWISAIANDCLMTAALLFSRGNFEKGITAVVSAGMDTDCNGATVGTILGVMNGAKLLPDKWKLPLSNTVKTDIIGVCKLKITQMAERAYKVIKINRNRTFEDK